jgi:N-acetylglutamate synthase-like GNAT family acetyltransferase
MKLVRWTRFTWNLATLPPMARPLDGRYTIRVASREEEPVVGALIQRAFSMDSEWSDQYVIFRDRLQLQLHQAFDREPVPAVVILHGVRIVAASALSSEVEADSNLLSGPCVLAEYCNRGFGSALLHESLVQLAHAGLSRAHAVSKDNTLASRFVYSKFGSTRADCELHRPPVTS